MHDATGILKFWFDDTPAERRFNSTPEFDALIKTRYLTTWEAARDFQCEAWAQTATGALALVIVLDQFPLNMFRGDTVAFSTEATARYIAARAIAMGFDADMDNDQRLFLYMPFQHSELMTGQDRALALFEKAGMDTTWVRHHRDIIARFGRFPHRNAVLGRASTPAEQEWLASDDAFSG